MGSLPLRNHPPTMYLTLFAGEVKAAHLGQAVVVDESPLTWPLHAAVASISSHSPISLWCAAVIPSVVAQLVLLRHGGRSRHATIARMCTVPGSAVGHIGNDIARHAFTHVLVLYATRCWQLLVRTLQLCTTSPSLLDVVTLLRVVGLSRAFSPALSLLNVLFLMDLSILANLHLCAGLTYCPVRWVLICTQNCCDYVNLTCLTLASCFMWQCVWSVKCQPQVL
jgi:hypothetical protein